MLDSVRYTPRKVGLPTIYTPNLHRVHLIMLVRPLMLPGTSQWLTYACASDDDYAVAAMAAGMNFSADAAFFKARSLNAPRSIFNYETGFMEARNASGAWAGEDQGWTEGDKWTYTFDMMHDIGGLIGLKGGNGSFVEFLDEHFDGGHNNHPNEVRLVAAPSKAMEFRH